MYVQFAEQAANSLVLLTVEGLVSIGDNTVLRQQLRDELRPVRRGRSDGVGEIQSGDLHPQVRCQRSDMHRDTVADTNPGHKTTGLSIRRRASFGVMAVDFHTDGHVAVFTLNRPEARNAVNEAVSAELENHLDAFEANDDLWIGIIAATGSVFCAGADLKAVSEGRNVFTGRGGFAGLVKYPRTKPLIAAVDGAAVAGGLEIVLSCDLVVASTQARFGIPEVKRSLVAAAGGLFRLPRAVPYNIAMEMALTGDPISAERAYQLGLVNELCEPGEAVARAMALAERINANAPLAVRASRQVMVDARLAADDDAWAMSGRAMGGLAKTNDYREGPRAFIEKRAPNWTGS